MKLEPAHVNQVLAARDGRMLEVSADAGGVVADLQALDPHLHVRFAENGNPPFFAVYWESDDKRTTELKATVAAFENSFGVWEGLDQRIVDRFRYIGSADYDFVAEVEKQNEQARKTRREEFREKMGDYAEQAAHALRKDLGIKSRVVKPRNTKRGAV